MIASETTPVAVQAEYSRLLTRTLPSVIESDEQNELYLDQVAELLGRENSLTPAEQELVKLLTLLIEDFEAKHYALPKASPAGVLRFLMDQHGIGSTDLAPFFSGPEVIDRVLNGEIDLDTAQIRRLSERFHVSPELFF